MKETPTMLLKAKECKIGFGETPTISIKTKLVIA